jgi:nitroimidazol reductase NimA-like FMN-containing flavoprotein (pyridoxamine 5'-phosphate oxidase superfamily)
MAEPTSARTTVKRLPKRGVYERDRVDAILDEALICHVGFVHPDGHPVVIPTIHARRGDELYLHGSPASQLLRNAKRGTDVCVTVTLIDELVLARSAFHHSMNYRSVVVFGRAEEVTDTEEKREALLHIVEHVAPGRSTEARPPNAKELAGTLVLRLPLDEASAKVRTGPPIDDDEDLDLPIWAGVLPLLTSPAVPVPSPDLRVTVDVPTSVTAYRRPRASPSRPPADGGFPDGPPSAPDPVR